MFPDVEIDALFPVNAITIHDGRFELYLGIDCDTLITYPFANTEIGRGELP
jgi:hypothetical protein